MLHQLPSISLSSIFKPKPTSSNPELAEPLQQHAIVVSDLNQPETLEQQFQRLVMSMPSSIRTNDIDTFKENITTAITRFERKATLRSIAQGFLAWAGTTGVTSLAGYLTLYITFYAAASAGVESFAPEAMAPLGAEFGAALGGIGGVVIGYAVGQNHYSEVSALESNMRTLLEIINNNLSSANKSVLNGILANIPRQDEQQRQTRGMRMAASGDL